MQFLSLILDLGSDPDSKEGQDPKSSTEALLFPVIGPDPNSSGGSDPETLDLMMQYLNLGSDPYPEVGPDPCLISRVI
jgi:hypothetical protein